MTRSDNSFYGFVGMVVVLFVVCSFIALADPFLTSPLPDIELIPAYSQPRRTITFYENHDQFLRIEGRCEIDDFKEDLEITCQLSEFHFADHTVHLGENVTYIISPLATSGLDEYHYDVVHTSSGQESDLLTPVNGGGS